MLGTGSIHSPERGKVVNQTQGSSSESHQEQQEMGPETLLQHRSEVHPGDEARDKARDKQTYNTGQGGNQWPRLSLNEAPGERVWWGSQVRPFKAIKVCWCRQDPDSFA